MAAVVGITAAFGILAWISAEIYKAASYPPPAAPPSPSATMPAEPAKPATVADPQAQIKQAEDHLAAAVAADANAAKTFVRFRLAGEVTVHDQSGIALWGTAVPLMGSHNALGTLLQNGNLVVRNPDANKSQAVGGFYTGLGFFVGQSTGTNAYGALVQVQVFDTQMPVALAAANAAVVEAKQRLDALKSQYQPAQPAETDAKK